MQDPLSSTQEGIQAMNLGQGIAPPPPIGPLGLHENEFRGSNYVSHDPTGTLDPASDFPPSMALARYEYVMSNGKTVELPAIKFRDQEGKQYVIAPTHPAIDREARTAAPEELTNNNMAGRFVRFVRSAVNKAFPTRRVFSPIVEPSTFDIQPQVLPLRDFESQMPLTNARSRSNHKTFNDIKLLPTQLEELTRFNARDLASSARVKAEMLRQSALRNLTPEERQSPERVQAAANAFVRKFLDDLSFSLRTPVKMQVRGILYNYMDPERLLAAKNVDWMRHTLAMQDPSEGPGGVQLTLASSGGGIPGITSPKYSVLTTNLDAIGNPIEGTTVRHRMEISMLTAVESGVSSSHQPSRVWKPTSAIEPLHLRSVNHSDVDLAFKFAAGKTQNLDDKTYSVLTNLHALDLLKNEIYAKHTLAKEQLASYEASLNDPMRDPTQYTSYERIESLRKLIVDSAQDLLTIEHALTTLTAHHRIGFNSNVGLFQDILESAQRHDPLPSYPEHLGVTSSFVPLDGAPLVHANQQQRQEKSPAATSEHMMRQNFA